MAINSRHLVDPELLPLLAFFPPLELTEELLPTIRAVQLPGTADGGEAPGTVEVTTLRIPGSSGAPDVGLMMYSPRDAQGPLPCILHIHGGGFVIGSAAAMQPAQRKLAATLGCIVLSVDYRLAPETRFPGAIEDCYAALSWAHAESRALGIDTDRLGVMGESAGGGLAAALALMARDRGEFRIAFQHLIYPMLDDRTAALTEPHPYAGELFWTAANNAFGWKSLLGQPPGSVDVSVYAAPARAVDLSGLPPTFISTGALDLFIDEDVEFARRLIRHGVPVELHVYPGAFHGFDLAPDARVARDANRDSLDALRRALGTDGRGR